MQTPQIVNRSTQHAEQLRAALDAKIRIIKRPEVEAATGLSRSSIYRGVAEGTFPAPVKLSARSVGWKLGDVVAWLESRVAGGAK